jgi:hypothetical protein
LFDEVVDIMTGFQHNITTLASVTTAWATFWAKGFAEQSHTSIAAVTGSSVNFYGINKHGCR